MSELLAVFCLLIIVLLTASVIFTKIKLSRNSKRPLSPTDYWQGMTFKENSRGFNSEIVKSEAGYIRDLDS